MVYVYEYKYTNITDKMIHYKLTPLAESTTVKSKLKEHTK